MKTFFINCILLALCHSFLLHVTADESEDVTIDDENSIPEDIEEIEVNYVTPKAPPNAYFVETFDDIPAVDKQWVKSRAKKENVDEDIAKYDGIWAVEPSAKDALLGDRGLVLKSKAKHAAISAAFKKKFVFQDKPLIVQYEVNLQNGQECGGAYIKLLSSSNKGAVDLPGFHDKTPYTIMFGPDKCGNDNKFHFIFRHVNPLTKEIEEKHCKRPSSKIEELFKDKRPHLLTLILQPDNTFEILLDHQVINTGNMLEDFTPSVNPDKEIDDPSDSKPDDWDEREKIPDPDSKKPVDWDEDAPMQIIDSSAVKPDGWLDDEPELIPDPSASKPEDWDDDMDGEWEAPLVSNPKCKEAKGCGEWRAPMIDNPSYKGKWKPTMINNPNYKGKWMPHKIPNPGYFEDLEPFKMTPIAAIGIELWSMSDDIYFDNFLITDNIAEAHQFSIETFDLKILKLEKGQTSMWDKILKITNYSPWMWLSYILYCLIPISVILYFIGKKVIEKGYINQIVEFSNKNPWIYGVYVLSLAIPVVLVYVCCCAEDVKLDKDANKKKTDEPSEDDPQANEEEDEEEEEAVEEEPIAESIDEAEDVDVEDANEDQEEISVSDKEPSKSDDDTRKSPRLRKVRKE